MASLKAQSLINLSKVTSERKLCNPRKQQLHGFLRERHPSPTLKELCYEVVWATPPASSEWSPSSKTLLSEEKEHIASRAETEGWTSSRTIKQKSLVRQSAGYQPYWWRKWGREGQVSRQWPLGREAGRNSEKKILLENVPWLKLHLSGARRQGEQTDLRGTEESGIGAVLILPSTPRLPLKDHKW